MTSQPRRARARADPRIDFRRARPRGKELFHSDLMSGPRSRRGSRPPRAARNSPLYAHAFKWGASARACGMQAVQAMRCVHAPCVPPRGAPGPGRCPLQAGRPHRPPRLRQREHGSRASAGVRRCVGIDACLVVVELRIVTFWARRRALSTKLLIGRGRRSVCRRDPRAGWSPPWNRPRPPGRSLAPPPRSPRPRRPQLQLRPWPHLPPCAPSS